MRRPKGADGGPVVARHVTVTGRVQGVSFRWSLRRVAERHGVRGWVINREDGAVEAHLEGAPDAVETVEAWVHAGGPPAAEVEDVEVREVAALDLPSFRIER